MSPFIWIYKLETIMDPVQLMSNVSSSQDDGRGAMILKTEIGIQMSSISYHDTGRQTRE